jgi:hypothetical protein
MTNLELLIKKDERLRTSRSPWESHWQELRDLVNPDASDFNRQMSQGARRTEQILDGTACWALEQLASGLHTFLTSPTDRWFNLDVRDYNVHADATGLAWLERVADIIYKQYGDPRSNAVDTLHECYQDLGSFGTAVVYQDLNRKEMCLSFRMYPLADCRILENSSGTVDTLFRSTKMSTRQIEQEWPDHGCKKITDCKDEGKMWEVVHAVFPRTDRDASKMNKTNKAFASVYFCKEAMCVFSESGYDEFPYHVPRWTKRAGEVYGRSPGMVCLPDIKLLNAMERVQLKAVQKIVDPPLMVPNDGFMLPISTKPSSLIFYEAGMGEQSLIKPLETKGRVDIGEDKMEQKRQHVLRCFYADWISRMKKKERQTATEIMDDRDEMLQMMSPILGRLQSELLGPMLARSYNLLQDAGLIPPAPSSLQRRDLHVVYVSPAAKAQVARKGVNMRRYIEELLPLAQVSPDILDAINTDEYAKQMALIQDVSRTVLRSPEELKAIRDQKAQAQQAQQMAQTAQPAASALKDIATAREKGLNI